MTIRILEAPEDKREFVVAYSSPASWQVFPAKSEQGVKAYRDPGDYLKVELVLRYCALIDDPREGSSQEWVIFDYWQEQNEFVKAHS